MLPDGRLASGSDDSTIRLWDVAAGVETARLEGHSGPVRRCACCRTAASPRAPVTPPSGCGTSAPAPRPPALRGTRVRSRRCACCRTDASPRAPGTPPSGCGTRPPASRPPAWRDTRSGRGAARAAGRPPRLGLLGGPGSGRPSGPGRNTVRILPLDRCEPAASRRLSRSRLDRE